MDDPQFQEESLNYVSDSNILFPKTDYVSRSANEGISPVSRSRYQLQNSHLISMVS
jgi:hypothetical protein